MSELSALDSTPGSVTLSTGTQIDILDLKAKQFFKLLKIITRGPGLALVSGGTNLLTGEPEEVMGRLLGILVISIPEAYDETIDFISSMIRPSGLRLTTAINKEAKQHNTVLWDRLAADMENPEMEDLLIVLEAVIAREAADLSALGKKVMGMVTVAQKTGQLKKPISQTSQVQNTSAASPQHMTRSAVNMDGPTPLSEISPFGVYDSAPQPLPRVPTYGTVRQGLV